MKRIFIVTTFTGTVLSSLIRYFTKVPYPHVSLSFNNRLKPMYSYGRKIPWSPLWAGFVHEQVDKGLFRLKPLTQCRVYTLTIDASNEEQLRGAVRWISKNRRAFKYDTTGLVRLYFDKNKDRHRYVCSTFVAEVLKKADIKIFDKEACLVTPMDFYNSNALELAFEGLLTDCPEALQVRYPEV